MLSLIVDSRLRLPLGQLSPELLERIKKEFTFRNPQYYINLRQKYSNFRTQEFIKGYRQSKRELYIPRGATSNVISLLEDEGIEYQVINNTRMLPKVDFEFHGELRETQIEPVEAILGRKFSTLSAPPGSGKTTISLYTVAKRSQPTLILVHTKALLVQWQERIEQFLEIDRKDIGTIVEGKIKLGEKITVGMVQTLTKCSHKVKPHIGYIICDECFPYNTLIKTDIGEIEIGKIVEDNLDINALSFNLETNNYEYKPILRKISNELKSNLIKIKHQFGEIICTPNHKLFIDGEGYVRADECRGKILRMVWEENRETNKKEKILQQRMSIKEIRGNTKREEKINNKTLRMVRDKCCEQREKSLLQPTLCKFLEDVCSRDKGKDFYRGGQKETNKITHREKESCGLCQNESQKSIFRSCECRKRKKDQREEWDVACLERRKRGKWKIYYSSTNLSRQSWLGDGGCYKNQQEISLPNLLQSRCWKSRIDDGNRSGRERSQMERRKTERQEENELFIRSRVDSIEILERGSDGRLGQSFGKNTRVYNLEVEGNHNYFAEGILVSNCHHQPAKSFSDVVSVFDSAYSVGLSATHVRRDKLERLIAWYLGPIVSVVGLNDLIKQGNVMMVEPIIRETNFRSNLMEPSWSNLISELILDEERNLLIANDVVKESEKGPCVVLSDRKAHCEILTNLIDSFGINVEMVTGDVKGEDRDNILKKLKEKKIDVIVATGQLLGEGFDEKSLTSLFLTTPISWSGRLTQYLGRISRMCEGKTRSVAYDYKDTFCDYLMKAFEERQRVYRKLKKESLKK